MPFLEKAEEILGRMTLEDIMELHGIDELEIVAMLLSGGYLDETWGFASAEDEEQ